MPDTPCDEPPRDMSPRDAAAELSCEPSASAEDGDLLLALRDRRADDGLPPASPPAESRPDCRARP